MNFKKRTTLILILLVTIIYSCSLEDDYNEITVYESNGTKITLLNVADSRCPDNPNGACVWAGNAEVLLRIEKNHQSENFVLNTNEATTFNEFETHINILDTYIELMDLEPYPTYPGQFSTYQYQVTLDIIE